MRVQCPECDTSVRFHADDEDRRITCPECGERFRPSELEDEEDEPAPKRAAKKKPAAKSQPKTDPKKANQTLILAVIGGVALLTLVASGIAVAVYLSSNDKPVKEVAGPARQNQPVAPQSAPANPNPVTPPTNQNPWVNNPGNVVAPRGLQPRRPDNKPDDPPPPGDPVGGPSIPGQVQPEPRSGQPMPASNPLSSLDELFRDSIDVKPPSMRVGVLKRDDNAAPLDVPTFHSLRMARKSDTAPVPKNVKLTLEEIKQATVYIKVDAGELSGTGSGFYIGSENGVALVATNHHVIEAAAGRHIGDGPKPKITAVFNSGVPGQERESVARIVAIDPIADLAVLRLDSPGKLPKPIDPWGTPKLTETMEVRICGFPFGETLATATKNPNISVNAGSVSSLRLGKGGNLEQVQISGSLNPGNSGGPIVDKDGRLAGIAVATITGSGLGFAVPVNDLIGLLEGRVMLTAFVPAGINGGAAKFRVVIPVMDPRGQVSTVFVRYWAGKGPKPQGVKDTKIGWKPIERAEQLNLRLINLQSSLSMAVGELVLPADAKEVVVQIASQNVGGLVAASPPVEYKLNIKDEPHGLDAKPFQELSRNPAAAVGRTMVLRAKVVLPPSGTAARQRMVVADAETGQIPNKIQFLTTRESACSSRWTETTGPTTCGWCASSARRRRTASPRCGWCGATSSTTATGSSAAFRKRTPRTNWRRSTATRRSSPARR
jgi:S1-C subfamily serine protease